MSRAAHGIIKGILIAITLAGAAFMFKQTIPISVDAAKNWRLLITGRYVVQPVSDALFYSFHGYAMLITIIFNLIPSSTEIVSPD